MFKRLTGTPKIEWYTAATSQLFSNGALCYANGSGAIIPADSTSGDHIGIIQRAIVAADDVYTTAGKVPVDVPNDEDEFEVDVGTGTATAAMIGNRYDLASSLTVDVSAQLKNVVTITRFISASKVVVKINAMISNLRVATT